MFEPYGDDLVEYMRHVANRFDVTLDMDQNGRGTCIEISDRHDPSRQLLYVEASDGELAIVVGEGDGFFEFNINASNALDIVDSVRDICEAIATSGYELISHVNRRDVPVKKVLTAQGAHQRWETMTASGFIKRPARRHVVNVPGWPVRSNLSAANSQLPSEIRELVDYLSRMMPGIVVEPHGPGSMSSGWLRLESEDQMVFVDWKTGSPHCRLFWDFGRFDELLFVDLQYCVLAILNHDTSTKASGRWLWRIESQQFRNGLASDRIIASKKCSSPCKQFEHVPDFAINAFWDANVGRLKRVAYHSGTDAWRTPRLEMRLQADTAIDIFVDNGSLRIDVGHSTYEPDGDFGTLVTLLDVLARATESGSAEIVRGAGGQDAVFLDEEQIFPQSMHPVN